MAKPPSVPAGKRRGRPPRPGGPTPQAEIQRAYRERLRAAGKVVKLIDPAAIPDPADFADMRERLRNALLKLKLREQDVARLEARNAYLEGELKLQEQHHTNRLKEIITLKQKAAQSGHPDAQKRAKPRPRRAS